MPIIAHTFSVVLGVLRNPQATKPRLQALRAISALVEYTRPGDDLADSWAIRASCLSKIFPGFSQCLFSTATGEKGRSSVLKANALRVWASLVESCFGDKPTSCIESLSEEDFAKLDLSEFTQWRLDAASRIQPLVGKCMEVLTSNTIDLSSSAVERLDWAVVDFASKAYHKLRDDLICSLIIVAAKSHSPLRQGQMTENCKSASASASALLHLSRLSQSSIGSEYAANGFDYIRKLAFGVLLRSSSELNSLLDFATDGRICALLLNRICGLIELLDIDGVGFLIESGDCLESLCRTVIRLLTFDLDSMRLTDQLSVELADPPLSEVAPVVPVHLFQKFFKYFRQPAILNDAERVVIALTSTCANFDDVSQILTDLLASSELQPAALQLLSASICGLARSIGEPSEKINLVTSLLDRLTAEHNFLDMNGPMAEPTTQTASALVSSWPAGQRVSNASTVLPLGDRPAVSSAHSLKERTLKACLFMELLATASQLWCHTDKGSSGGCASQGATYPEELQPLLVQVLGLATGSGLLSATARQALFCISRRCGFASFSDFISASSGPLISALTLDFHSVIIQAPLFEGSSGECGSQPPAGICSRLETACRALTFFTEHANYEAIHRIRPLVMQMLMCLDVTYDFAAAHFLPVLTKIIRTCRRIDDDANHPTATPSTMVADPSTTSLPTSTASQPKVSFVELLEDRRKDKVLLSDCMDATFRATLKLLCDTRRQHSYAYADKSSPSSLASVIEDSPAQPLQKADVSDAQTSVADDAPTLYPDQIRLVEEVMLRSVHLMSCDVPRLRIASMSLLCEGCCLLARHDDLLLPLVHKIWSPLLARMRDKNPAVVERAFELFAVLANCSRTFIRSRASSDLMNTLVVFLERGASVSLGEPASYEFLTACRVQRRLLQTLGPLCVQLELFAVSLRPVVQVLCTYLNTKQPKGLREAAAQSLLHLYSLDPGLVAFECDSQRGRGT
ncbi:TEL2-interacting protein 1 [Sparganum proliferum]